MLTIRWINVCDVNPQSTQHNQRQRLWEDFKIGSFYHHPLSGTFFWQWWSIKNKKKSVKAMFVYPLSVRQDYKICQMFKDTLECDDGMWWWNVMMECNDGMWRWNVMMDCDDWMWWWNVMLECDDGMWWWNVIMEYDDGMWWWNVTMECDDRMWRWTVMMECDDGIWWWN